MQDQNIYLQIQELKIPFTITVRHASAVRITTKSIWVEAIRGENSGFGEGCPRDYVTGENFNNCHEWFIKHRESIQTECLDLDKLQIWLSSHQEEIDRNSSIWCAIEAALLELFAKENDCSVETLLGLMEPNRLYSYTAILGDDQEHKYKLMIDKYLAVGMSDFKIKLNGDLERDQQKLHILHEQAKQHQMSNIRIRLDANNLWDGQLKQALTHLKALDIPFWAIEEPVASRAAREMGEISQAISLPVILDESLCRLEDINLFEDVPGNFIANIKISKVGGVLRAIPLIEAIKKRGWPIIIGAHVGETSVLTRAAMLVAQVAGESLIAQEGAFGTNLLKYEICEPSLKFARKGIIDLRQPYIDGDVKGSQIYTPEHWHLGWGLKARKLQVRNGKYLITKEIPQYEQSDQFVHTL
ncbi:MAG: hypothetical protein HQK75_19090 [Candidatus Magnetomorum sp.]|nr:hypothetical protein [Candidatus Magnetomorum sp.]